MNRARPGDTRLGLRKDIVERNCSELSNQSMIQNRGDHTLQELAVILKAERFEKMVGFIVDYLKDRELPRIKPEQQKQHLSSLLNFRKLEPHEVEAVRRVYRELYGEPPV
jgi:hypothetical protein